MKDKKLSHIIDALSKQKLEEFFFLVQKPDQGCFYSECDWSTSLKITDNQIFLAIQHLKKNYSSFRTRDHPIDKLIFGIIRPPATIRAINQIKNKTAKIKA